MSFQQVQSSWVNWLGDLYTSGLLGSKLETGRSYTVPTLTQDDVESIIDRTMKILL